MKTTLYFSEKVEPNEYPYEKLNEALKKLNFSINEKERTIEFKSLILTYRLRYKKSIGRYILAFALSPPDEQITTSETIRRYGIICEFIDVIPEQINLDKSLSFSREELKEFIDINQWKIQDSYTLQRVDIFNGYNLQKLKECYSGKILLKPLFLITKESNNAQKIINNLKIFFSSREEIVKTSLNLTRDLITSRGDKKELFILVLYTGELSEDYIRLKKFFLQNNIPSQFLNMDDKEFFFKTKNLIPEILTKAGCYPFKFPDDLSKVDGYICLNDVYNENNPLFGININYNSENNVFQNKIKIYSDIQYESDRFRIKFTEKDIDLLIKKIATLSPELKGKKINLYLTKYWKYDNLKFLKEKLNAEQIEINKIFHISFLSDKFVFKGLENLERGKVPYLIKDKNVAYIQPNTKIGLFGSLFPIGLELLIPDLKQEINQEDIGEYLWLIKRQAYRLQYIEMLRYPEFLKYSKKIRDLKLSDSELSQLTLNGDLLI